MRITRESCAIAIIGLLDLIATILFIRLHGAQEANPLFRALWAIGPTAFIAVKLLFIAGPISVLEWARCYNPRFVARASRGVIAAYVICYGLGVAHLNSPAEAQKLTQYASQADERIVEMEYQIALAQVHDSKTVLKVRTGQRPTPRLLRTESGHFHSSAAVQITGR